MYSPTVDWPRLTAQPGNTAKVVMTVAEAMKSCRSFMEVPLGVWLGWESMTSL